MGAMKSFRLLAEDMERLRRLSVRRTWESQRRVGESEIMREALALYMTKYEPKEEEQ